MEISRSEKASSLSTLDIQPNRPRKSRSKSSKLKSRLRSAFQRIACCSSGGQARKPQSRSTILTSRSMDGDDHAAWKPSQVPKSIECRSSLSEDGAATAATAAATSFQITGRSMASTSSLPPSYLSSRNGSRFSLATGQLPLPRGSRDTNFASMTSATSRRGSSSSSKYSASPTLQLSTASVMTMSKTPMTMSGHRILASRTVGALAMAEGSFATAAPKASTKSLGICCDAVCFPCRRVGRRLSRSQSLNSLDMVLDCLFESAGGLILERIKAAFRSEVSLAVREGKMPAQV